MLCADTISIQIGEVLKMDMKMDWNVNTKAIAITAGAIGGVTLMGVIAAMVYNSKQMKAMRAVKRVSKVMYHVGTAMRNVSGEACGE